MKKFIFSILYIFLTIRLFGQLFSINNEEGVNYYKNGISYLQIGNYKTADSLFSLALCTFKNSDIYFNRSIAKLSMYDTLGFCDDLNIAANKYFDKEANKIFNKVCCTKVDTIYYNKKFIKSTKLKFRYLEEIKYAKYDTSIIGIIHDIKTKVPEFNIDFGCDDAIIGMNNNTSDIIGVYEIEDSVKYYIRSTKNPVISNLDKYKKVNNQFKKHLSVKYDSVKKEYKLDKLTIYYYIKFSETGEPINIEFAGFFPEISYNFSTEKMNKDLSILIKLYPYISPAKFLKKKVRSISIGILSF